MKNFYWYLNGYRRLFFSLLGPRQKVFLIELVLCKSVTVFSEHFEMHITRRAQIRGYGTVVEGKILECKSIELI